MHSRQTNHGLGEVRRTFNKDTGQTLVAKLVYEKDPVVFLVWFGKNKYQNRYFIPHILSSANQLKSIPINGK